MRYIDADALLKAVEGYTDMTKADLLYILEDIPTADVEEVRHGYWYIPEYEYLACSECGAWCFAGAEANRRLANGECSPFCPHCGAKMDGRSEK